MSFVAIIETINFILAGLAALISFGILRKVAGNLASSWRYSFIAFQLLALAMLFTAAYELGISYIARVDMLLLRYTAHFIFVILAFFGLLRQYQLLRGLTKRGNK